VPAFYENHPYPNTLRDLDRHRELYRASIGVGRGCSCCGRPGKQKSPTIEKRWTSNLFNKHDEQTVACAMIGTVPRKDVAVELSFQASLCRTDS
jgi:hypothetical protein